MGNRILIAEDEPRLREVLCDYLLSRGDSPIPAENGEKALLLAQEQEFDGVLLDIMMPKLDGLSLLKTLRAEGRNAPALFLTARDSVANKVEGLDSGADYYLTKPFAFKELMAVVRTITRKNTGTKTSVYTIADLSLDSAAKTVVRGGKNILLSAREFALLEYMMRNKGVVLSREMIENNLWNYDYEGGSNVVDVYVGYLRKKVDAPFEKKLIHTVWGTGWVLREDK